VLVLVIVDRQEGAEEYFRDKGYSFRAVFTKNEIAEIDHVAAS
jgi:orotate phosphoribosyltransferase